MLKRSRKVDFIISSMIFVLAFGTLTFVVAHNNNPQSSTAHAASNGQGRIPYMGWSSWSVQSSTHGGYGKNYLTAQNLMNQSDYMHQKLQFAGYNQINIDAGWWMDFNWNDGYDGNGIPQPDAGRFPSGIQSVIDHIHANGQNVGIYFPVGLPSKVYNANSAIQGTSCHAQDIVQKPLHATNYWRTSYSIDYSNPCGQAYYNSIANRFASWGIVFMKLDGVLTEDIPEVNAWSKALNGKGIWLTISWSLDRNQINTWKQSANAIRIENDVECYCDTLTSWNNSVYSRFVDAPYWASYVDSGYKNDLDSIDIGNESGNGVQDGLNNNERQTVMTLWSIEEAPLYTGDDLYFLDSYGISLLTNNEVIAQDRVGIAAKPVSQSSNQQVWTTNNGDGTYTVALFNLDGSNSATVTANWNSLGFSGSANVHDMWSHSDLGSFTSSFSASIAPHGSRLLKVRPGGSTPTATPTSHSYEAEAQANNVGAPARIASCSFCSGGSKVGYMGKGGTLQFNGVNVSAGGSHTLTLYYIDGDASGGGRTMFLSVNGGGSTSFTTPGNGNWSSVQSMNVTINLNAGSNTLFFSNGANYAADIDRIVIK